MSAKLEDKSLTDGIRPKCPQEEKNKEKGHKHIRINVQKYLLIESIQKTIPINDQ